MLDAAFCRRPLPKTEEEVGEETRVRDAAMDALERSELASRMGELELNASAGAASNPTTINATTKNIPEDITIMREIEEAKAARKFRLARRRENRRAKREAKAAAEGRGVDKRSHHGGSKVKKRTSRPAVQAEELKVEDGGVAFEATKGTMQMGKRERRRLRAVATATAAAHAADFERRLKRADSLLAELIIGKEDGEEDETIDSRWK